MAKKSSIEDLLIKMNNRLDSLEKRLVADDDPPERPRRARQTGSVEHMTEEDIEIERALANATAPNGRKRKGGKAPHPVETVAPVIRGANKDGTGHWSRCQCAKCTK